MKTKDKISKMKEILIPQHKMYNSNTILDIHNKEDQVKIKWFIYCILEEMYELVSSETETQKYDEMCDILNFTFSLVLSLGYEPADMYVKLGDQDKDPSFNLLAAGHKLKNRYWKNTCYLTDEYGFKSQLDIAFSLIIDKSEEFENIIEELSKKVETNLKRKGTNY